MCSVLAYESNFTRCAPDINPWNEFRNYTVEIELRLHLPGAAELSKICFVHVTEFYSISSYIKLNANQIWFSIWKLNRPHAMKCFSEQNKCLVRFALADYTDIFYYSTADACGHPAESPSWYLARKGNTFPFLFIYYLLYTLISVPILQTKTSIEYTGISIASSLISGKRPVHNKRMNYMDQDYFNGHIIWRHFVDVQTNIYFFTKYTPIHRIHINTDLDD